MGIEFIDLEITFPEDLLEAVISARGPTRIIASHHDPRGDLSWASGSWIPFYSRALQYGDVVKLVGIATSINDNFALADFTRVASSAHEHIPLIALNMGEAGKLSRVLNGVLTPVSHPDLPFKAAPGQLSVAEIRQGLALLGQIKKKTFYIFGSPVSASRSPVLHNTLFRETGLPHHYTLHETTSTAGLESLVRDPDFGGASVTIPLKVDIMPLLDSISPSAKAIGAVNTIVSGLDDSGALTLIGYNTDYLGMMHVLNPVRPVSTLQPAMVIGSGGTSRAAIYALHEMGFSPIYIAARNPRKASDLIEAFTSARTEENVCDLRVYTVECEKPVVAIGTIPGMQPIASELKILVEHAMEGRGESKVFLEMAYKPSPTPLEEMAIKSGWKIVGGLDVLAAQGWEQFRLWTGIRTLFEEAGRIVKGE